jgi:hypothetical protein
MEYNQNPLIGANPRQIRFSFSLNLTNLPQNVTFMIGETWDFQAWYRDGAASTSNFTDGIEVMFR